MNIAILTPTFSGFSGPDRVAWNEAEELAKKHNITIICFSADLTHATTERITLGAPKNKTLERIYKLAFFLDVPKVAWLAWHLRKYDHIISFLYPMTVPAFLARMLWRKRYTYYDVGLAYPQLFEGVERLAMQFIVFMTRLSVANATDAISISKFCQDELRRMTGRRSRVKYVKTNTKRFSRKVNRQKVAAVKKKYGLRGPTLLYIGRISPHKGVHLLLQAFEKVKAQSKDAKLLVVGKHTFDAYSQQLRKTGDTGIIYTGFVSDEELPHYYGAADAYTTASLWEGFDIPAVDAQKCGKPVIAFDVGSHREVVKKGKLVRAGDVDAFAKAILEVLKR